eukprot:2028532-Amphidinium_carterae.2
MCVRTKSGSALHERLFALRALLAVLGTVACLHFFGYGSLYTFAPSRCSEFGLPKDEFTYPTICCHPAVHMYQGGTKRRAPVPLRARQKTKNLKKQTRSEAVISLSSDEPSLIVATQDGLCTPVSVVDVDSTFTPVSPPSQVCLPVRFANEDQMTNDHSPPRVSHIEAVREHLWHREVHVSAQSLIGQLEDHLASEMATSAGWVRLAQEIQFVDQCLNHPANLKSDFSSDCYLS